MTYSDDTNYDALIDVFDTLCDILDDADYDTDLPALDDVVTIDDDE
jgi:hypothetical protein